MQITNALIIQFAIGILVMVLGILVKKIPKQKIIDKLMPICINIGKVISKFLIIRFGKSGFDNLAEGLIVSFLDIISKCLGFISLGLQSHNEEIKKKKFGEDKNANSIN